MADSQHTTRESVCKTPHTCQLCGKQFFPKRTDRTKFCGRACGLAWSGFRTKVNHTGGRVFVRVLRRKATTWLWPQHERQCAKCGSTFVPARTGGRFQTICSDECRAIAKRDNKRPSKKARRAKERGASRADRIDPIKVFERDGWRCMICGRKTPQSARGTTDPRAPELDHIVAISLGGAHAWDNVQCACRRCNAKKGASVYGQLHLFPAG